MAEEDLSKASIFKAVQALIKCSYIKVSGVELVGKTYARQLEAEISKEEYAALVLMEKGFTRSSLGEIAVAMTGSDHGSKASSLENEKLIHDLVNNCTCCNTHLWYLKYSHYQCQRRCYC